jgi:hypothetical protein
MRIFNLFNRRPDIFKAHHNVKSDLRKIAIKYNECFKEIEEQVLHDLQKVAIKYNNHYIFSTIQNDENPFILKELLNHNKHIQSTLYNTIKKLDLQA